VAGDLLRWSWPYVRPERSRLLAVFGLSLLGTALALALPLLSRDLVDRALVPGDAAALLRLVLLFVLLTALGFVVNVGSGLLYTRASAEALFAMRLDVYRHLQRLSPRFFARTPLGDLVSRLNHDVGEVQRVAAEMVLASFGHLLFLAGSLFMLARLAPGLLLLTLAVLLPGLGLLWWARRRLAARVKTLRERSADLGSFLVETLQALRLTISSSAEEREVGRFRDKNAGFVRALLELQLASYAAGGGPALLLGAGAAAVFLVGGLDVIGGRLTLGTLVAFMAYEARLLGPLQGLMGLYTALATAGVSLGRVREVLDEPVEVREAKDPVHLASVRGALFFEEVTFSFDRGTPVLERVSFRAEPGETVAIVGPSGAGKSTIVDLLLRLYDPDTGGVFLDGHDLRTLRLSDLRREVGVVEQTPFLLHASLAENVRYAAPEASEAEVAAAALAAGLADAAARWPRGLHTVVGERGLALSAGERQRVALARALLRRPKVLVLDEPTSALDPETERAVLAAFDRLREGRTTLVVTHRPLLADRADRVVVMSGARVVQEGPPAALRAREGALLDLFGPA
jgi:ATP-binding cassette subfamily B protein